MLGATWGVASLHLQRHFAAEAASGTHLNLVTRALADGSGTLTAWPGYAATVLFLGAAVRMRLGPPEPPPGRFPTTASSMRTALRREFRLVRAALAAVSVLAGVDAVRAITYAVAAIRGWQVARNSIGATAVEAAGILCAAVALWLWLEVFRRQLIRWGAL